MTFFFSSVNMMCSPKNCQKVNFTFLEAKKSLREATWTKEKRIQHPATVTNYVQSSIHHLNQQLNAEHFIIVKNLHPMTTERNSLHELMNTSTSKHSNKNVVVIDNFYLCIV
uniref:Uncharacterized protein n=1 Tax=Trichobilharzia regenti TaxID=157069 RepID=A0AA85JSL9_TRIRE|nr:unnamed protein product [Trichobilharzia regenti]